MSTISDSAAKESAIADRQRRDWRSRIPGGHLAGHLALPAGVRPYAAPLILYGVAKLVGLAVFARLLESAGDYHEKNPRFGGGAHWWDVLGSWDGWWYLQVAEKGYDPRPLERLDPGGMFTVKQNSVAYFPLYPGLIRAVSEITGLGLFGAGLLVSVLASFVAAAGIYAVISLLAGARAGTIAAGLWAVSPGAGTEWAVYSESLFVAIAAWCCYAVMKRQWVAAGLLAFAAGRASPGHELRGSCCSSGGAREQEGHRSVSTSRQIVDAKHKGAPIVTLSERPCVVCEVQCSVAQVRTILEVEAS